jgi:hypothetical protein
MRGYLPCSLLVEGSLHCSVTEGSLYCSPVTALLPLSLRVPALFTGVTYTVEGYTALLAHPHPPHPPTPSFPLSLSPLSAAPPASLFSASLLVSHHCPRPCKMPKPHRSDLV